jgi:pullulanase/glycogen debranching enzyme
LRAMYAAIARRVHHRAPAGLVVTAIELMPVHHFANAPPW